MTGLGSPETEAEGGGTCCRYCGPIIPPLPAEGERKWGGGGIAPGPGSSCPGKAGPTAKPQWGQNFDRGGTTPWHPGHNLAAQCSQNLLLASISRPQFGHLIVDGTKTSPRCFHPGSLRTPSHPPRSCYT